MDPLEEWLSQPDGVASRLRALRVQAGLTATTLADTLGWAPSKVTRIQRGQQMPSPEDVQAWARACGASDSEITALLAKREDARIFRETFKSRLREGQAAEQKAHTDLAATSTLVRHFETAYIPGFLQVPEYARRVFTESREWHQLPVDDVDAAVAERMRRQQMIYDPSRQFEFLVTEAVLRFLLIPPAGMRTQLDRLQTVIGLDNVRFGIIPFGVPLATTPQNSVVIYSGEDLIAVTETFVGEEFHDGAEATEFSRAVDLLWKDAAEGEAARQIVIEAARGLPD